MRSDGMGTSSPRFLVLVNTYGKMWYLVPFLETGFIQAGRNVTIQVLPIQPLRWLG